MSGCGTRIVLRGQKPLALCDRCPCFGSLFPPLAALTFAASSIICAFGLASAAPRSPYRHLELCGIALYFVWIMRKQKTDFQDSVSFSLSFTSLSLASTIEITFSSTSRTTAGCRQLLLMALMTDFWSSSIFAVVVISSPFCHRGAGIFRARIACIFGSRAAAGCQRKRDDQCKHQQQSQRGQNLHEFLH
ncbi:MAG: hypothetical protein ACLT8A_10095 [Subdoligranulum sp.]